AIGAGAVTATATAAASIFYGGAALAGKNPAEAIAYAKELTAETINKAKTTVSTTVSNVIDSGKAMVSNVVDSGKAMASNTIQTLTPKWVSGMVPGLNNTPYATFPSISTTNAAFPRTVTGSDSLDLSAAETTNPAALNTTTEPNKTLSSFVIDTPEDPSDGRMPSDWSLEGESTDLAADDPIYLQQTNM
ncbi:MAG: hypothetical protein LBJ81_00815, partial [Puniceicoccales bacterium]|nr:hypothetical protein [Puniceicoccales bacterium]